MDTINEVLHHYGLTLAECDDEWAETVQEFQRVKSAMPAHIAAQREKEIADSFLVFHDVTEEKPEPAPVKKPAPAGNRPQKGGKTSAPSKPYTYNEQALFDKADKMLKDLD